MSLLGLTPSAPSIQHSFKERRSTLIVPQLDVGAGLDKKGSNLRLARDDRDYQWKSSCRSVKISTQRDEGLDRLRISPLGSVRQIGCRAEEWPHHNRLTSLRV